MVGMLLAVHLSLFHGVWQSNRIRVRFRVRERVRVRVGIRVNVRLRLGFGFRVMVNSSQLAKMKKSIPDMSMP